MTVAAIVAALWVAGWNAATLAASQAPQQAPQSQATGSSAPEGFVPVKALPAQEQLPAVPLLLTAYAFVWLVLLVYLWTIWRRLMKVEREIRTLADRVGGKSARP
jgi:CcmD family protein